MLYIVLFLLGNLVGIYLHHLASYYHRNPKEWSAIFKCEECGQRPGWLQFLPISRMVLSASAHSCCSTKNRLKNSLLEALPGLIYVGLYLKFENSLDFLLAIVFSTLLLAGMWIDLEQRLIPNVITIAGIVIGLSSALFLRRPVFLDSVLGILICGGFLYLGGLLGGYLFHKPNAMGGGDIKYAAMIGSFLGWENGFWAVYVATVAATMYGVIVLLKHRGEKGREICFGPFLAGGAVLILLLGNAYVFF